MKRMLMLVIVLIMCLSAVAVQADALNPEFKVQYYAYLPRFSTTGGTALKVIDTSGAVLPQNGTTPATTSLRVDSKGNVMTDNKLTKIYTTRTLKFVQYPGLRYIDQVSETNANYVLDQIWLSSNNGSSWYKKIDYTSGDYSFTNIAGQEDLANRVIAVSDNTVIRLVYAPNSSTYTHSAKFFDYDITDGSKSPVDSNLEGINSNSGWKGSGTKLGFGNQNTNNGIGLLTWNKNGKNYPNAGNNNGYQLCTFGLVTGLKDGLPVFANNLQYKDWFGPTKLTGKTEIKGWNLKFDRVGDTYTLAYVNNGTKNITNDLTKFSHPGSYTHIWTNNFWPMDSSSTWGASGHDIKWGNYDLRYQRLYKVGTSTGVLPWSDDGLDHNSYFGMTYTVDFTLSKDYVGPLDYTFFGDDDMWVFLEDKKTGKTTLVCDIGGVHSSVGEYVNLRDYLKNGTSGDYRLHFFYTERGASGSTCYMQFTLPSVNNVIPTAKYSTLKLEKVVKGAATQEAFDFTVDLEEVSGTAANNYAYTVYNKNNSVASNGIINGNKTVSLKDGQYALIPNLFVGTTYKVAEADTNPYYSPSAPYYSGTINEVGKTITVSYVNTAKQLVEITIPKTDSITHAPVNGAQFSLTHAANCCDYKGIAGATATSASGAVKFTGVLVGHTYSLTETKVPTGYDSAAAYKGTVTVSADGVVTVDGKAVASAAIENDPLFWPDAITVPVKKNVAATDVFAKADMQKFVFELYACDENGNVTGAALASKSPDANGNLTFEGLDAFLFDTYEESKETRYFLVKEKQGTNLHIDYDVEHEYLITARATVSDKATTTKPAGTPASANDAKLAQNGAFAIAAAKTVKVRDNAGSEWKNYAEDAAAFTNTDKVGGLSFVKKNADTGAVLAGAEFTLTHDAQCSACGGNAQALSFTQTSGQDGKVTFTNVPTGHEYILAENKAPAGYEISFASRKVLVGEDSVTNFEDIAAGGIANKPVYQPDAITVPVKKNVAATDVFAKADMQKFVFELYACDENGNVTGAALASKSPDANGNLTFEGLDAFLFDTYAESKETRYFLVKEKQGTNLHIDYDVEHEYLITAAAALSDAPVNGKFVITASTAMKVRENGGAWQTFSGAAAAFTNVDKVGGLSFVKKNADTGAVLAGAEFTLTHDAQCSACGGNAQALSFTQTSGQDGKVTFTNVPTGHEYVLAETKAPAGYEISFASRKVLVGEDVVTNFEDIAAGGITNKPVYQPDAITIPVKKIVAAEDVYAKADMQKFVFELYGCDENGNVTGAALASKSPDANGDLVFSGLDAFVFDDYADSDDTRYFLVREVGGTNLYIDYDVEHEYLFTATAALSDAPVNGKFVFTTNKTMKVRENGGAWQETSAAAAEFTNTDKASGFSFVKKNADTGAVLAGAVFTLTHDTGCEACNGNARELVFTATSDAEGKISFESVPAGHEYVLEETKAPAGYDISFAKRTVKVTDSNVLNFEDIAADGIANKPLYWPDDISVTVEKQVGEDDVYAKADMQKFVFELYACDESGNVTGAALASKSPDADGKVVFEGINEFLFDDYKDSKETRHFLIKEFRGSNPFIVYDSERAYLITASATLSQTATNSKPEGTPASAADEKLAANGAFALTASTTIKFRETPNDAWQIYGGNAVIFANSDCKRTGFEFTKVSSFNDRELNGAEFTLTHSASCGCGYTHQDIPAIIAEAVNGKVTFGDKVETQILTGHKYLLKETKAPNGFELMNGVTYTVLADADGNVTYTRNETSGGKPIAGDSMMTRGLYENRPDYLPLSIEIEARKLYNNEIPVNTGENYMFALFDEEITENNFGLLNTPSTLPTLKGTKGFIEYVYNDGEGKIKFTPITVEKAGTYTYWILEVPGTIADVKYDKTIYKVTVTVDETVNPDGSGTPVVEYTYEANGQACYTDGLPTFNNYFVPDTGDHSNILFWLMLLGCTGCVMAMMIRRRREN